MPAHEAAIMNARPRDDKEISGMNRRVVITGLGVVSPVGIGKENYWRALEAGENGVRRITTFDASDFSVKIAGEVQNFDATPYMPKKDVKRTDRAIQFATVASTLAIEDAKLDLSEVDPWRFGAYIGSGIGGLHTIRDGFQDLEQKGPRLLSPYSIPMMIANMPSAYVAIKFGCKGPNMCIVTACASSVNSIGEAWHAVKRGNADLMLAGGTEACVMGLTVGGFGSMKALCSNRNDDPEHASRPFDKDRSGFIVAEGAGIILMEELEHALARGAHIYGELTGYGALCDAYHITAPDPEGVGAQKTMELAMKQSGWDGVDLVNAHGTSTHLNEIMESRAINNLLGEKAKDALVTSTKSIFGHALGAAGGVAVVAALQSFEEGIVHKTRNYETPDPECDVNVVAETLHDQDIRRILVNNFGFGGHNGVLALQKYEH